METAGGGGIHWGLGFVAERQREAEGRQAGARDAPSSCFPEEGMSALLGWWVAQWVQMWEKQAGGVCTALWGRLWEGLPVWASCFSCSSSWSGEQEWEARAGRRHKPVSTRGDW